MAECSCGCGRPLGGFRDPRKRADTAARRSDEKLVKLRALPPAVKKSSKLTGLSPDKALGMVDEYIAKLVEARRTCRAVVHEEREIGLRELKEIEKTVKAAGMMEAALRPALRDQAKKAGK